MPDYYTHTYAMDLIAEGSSEEVQKLLYSNIGLLYTASQGPDPIFYHKFTSIKKGQSWLANKMHNTHTGDFFIQYASKLKQLPNSIKTDLFPHISGMIAHFMLDTTAHPYVFYKTGVYKKNDPSTYKYRGEHIHFEKLIDSYLIQDILGANPRKYKLYKRAISHKDLPDSLTELLDEVLYNLYNVKNGGTIYKESVQQMNFFMRRICYDPKGIVRFLLKPFDLIDKKKSMIYHHFSYYRTLDPNIDYLNRKESKWLHPQDDQEVHYENFYTLINQSKEKAIDKIQKLYSYLFTDNIINLEEVFENLSYSTGRKLSEGEEMQFFELYK